MAKVAILGHGVVGSGTAQVLMMNQDGIAERAGEAVEVKYILDIRDFPDLPYADRFTKDIQVILGDPEVEIVAEVIGGLKPAYDFVSRCLKAGKSVVTSNKELVAAKGAELLQTAKEHGVLFLFEASVGGGIPIIRPMAQCMAANEIERVTGILNGTTNYILTRMFHEQQPFDVALRSAQELGYAEADPTADVEGIDACRKICILSSLAFGRHVYPEYVHAEGISKLTAADVEMAAKEDRVIKLLGITRKYEDGTVFAMVAPFAISRTHLLAGVEDVFNGIVVKGNAVDEVAFVGRGAGKLPTASAVVADIIDCVKHRGGENMMKWADCKENIVRNWEEERFCRLVRVAGEAEHRVTEPMNEAEFAATFSGKTVESAVRML
ncbi:MAG: homoserine dehydrogenase [Clostridia bacterium]|nr:homoserine dehydrogenase [Clostridia bacterium]